MLETLILVLLILWLLGFLGGVALPLVGSSSAVHILIVIVLILVAVRLLQGRSVL